MRRRCCRSTAPFRARGAQQDITFFRILTGGTVGTYFPIGGLIANAISNPPGSRPCTDGGSCGVPGLVATLGDLQRLGRQRRGDRRRQRAVGLRAVRHRLLGLQRHRHLQRPAEGRRACGRSPTSIPRASSWWCARARASSRCQDLRGRKISLDEPGSGTLVDARLILQAFGLSEKDLQARVLPGPARRRQPEGRHDRRLLQRQRLAAELGRRPRRHGRHRAGADRRARGRQADRAVQLLQQRGDPRQRLQGRGRREDRERARDLGDLESSRARS